MLDFLQMSQATEKHHSPHDSDRVPFRGRSRPTSQTQYSLQSSRDQAKGSVFSTVRNSDLYSKNASSSLPGLKGGKTPNRGDAGPRCSAKTLHCAWQSPSSNNTPSHSQRGSTADVGRWRLSFFAVVARLGVITGWSEMQVGPGAVRAAPSLATPLASKFAHTWALLVRTRGRLRIWRFLFGF